MVLFITYVHSKERRLSNHFQALILIIKKRMNTLSLLRDIREIKELKVRILPINNAGDIHKDIEWVRNEYTNWAKQFPDYDQNITDMLVNFVGIVHIRCVSKERLLSLAKAIEIGFICGTHLLIARKERSLEMAVHIIDQLIETLKTGKCDQYFMLGKRFLESLEPLRNEMSAQQFNTIKILLESGFEAYLDIHCNYYLKDQFIPLKEYVYKRSHEPFWPYLVHLSEYSVDLNIPETIRTNDLFNYSDQKFVELVLAANDYYLATKKIMSNDNTSRVICYLNENRCSLQNALDNQFEYVMDLNKECNQLMNKIIENPNFESNKLNDCLFTKYNNFRSVYQIVGSILMFELSADQTIKSNKLDQIYNNLVKQNQSLGSWFLWI